MGVLMEGSAALTAVQSAVTSLQADVTTAIPAALGVAVVVFGAKYIWRTVKGLVR